MVSVLIACTLIWLVSRSPWRWSTAVTDGGRNRAGEGGRPSGASPPPPPLLLAGFQGPGALHLLNLQTSGTVESWAIFEYALRIAAREAARLPPSSRFLLAPGAGTQASTHLSSALSTACCSRAAAEFDRLAEVVPHVRSRSRAQTRRTTLIPRIPSTPTNRDQATSFAGLAAYAGLPGGPYAPDRRPAGNHER
jgi:hypothetical protein